MKHNLFLAMLAAALLGGQVFAEPVVYRFSELSDGQTIEVNMQGQEVMAIVDAEKFLYSFWVVNSQCLTIDYQGEYMLVAMNGIGTTGTGVLNITSTVGTVITKWEDTFSVEGGGAIPLCASTEVAWDYATLQFFGQDAGSTVKLGDTDVQFVGRVSTPQSLDMNQVGVVCNYENIYLAGKVQKSVPEPTTGSLSLLALAGLCARRRRK